VHSRFRRWTLAGVWESLFQAFSADPDPEYVQVDETICKTQADAAAQKGGLEAAGIGRSKSGLTLDRQSFACKSCERTKMHAAVEASGLPVRFTITPGRCDDSSQARALIEGQDGAGHVNMGAGYDAVHLRAFIADDLAAIAHIKRNPTRREDRPIDRLLYEARHLVECVRLLSRTGGVHRLTQQTRTRPAHRRTLPENRQLIQGFRRPRLRNGADHVNADAARRVSRSFAFTRRTQTFGDACARRAKPVPVLARHALGRR
jgi:transposase